jgi:hypothetical protein
MSKGVLKAMKEKIWISVDNGSTGSIGFVNKDITNYGFIKTPKKRVRDYTIAKNYISRLDHDCFKKIFKDFKEKYDIQKIILERPLKNPSLFKASVSGIRFFEAQIVILEQLELDYIVVDSKQWQKEILGKDIKGSKMLKAESLNIGYKIFPNMKEIIVKHGDADGLLIAEYFRRKEVD